MWSIGLRGESHSAAGGAFPEWGAVVSLVESETEGRIAWSPGSTLSRTAPRPSPPPGWGSGGVASGRGM